MGEKAVISAIKNLEEAIGQFDRASTRPQLEQAETQRGASVITPKRCPRCFFLYSVYLIFDI